MLNKSAILKIFIIFWLTCRANGQNAKCDYKYDYYWTDEIKTINASFYTCDLDTKQSNYNEKLTIIDGQHETGKSDADVKNIRIIKDNKLKTFSSIFCQKFPNLMIIVIRRAQLEIIDEDSLKNCKNLIHLTFAWNNIHKVHENMLNGNLKLTFLWIRDNELAMLPENVFKHQKNLHNLILVFNQFHSLPSNIFRSLINLDRLYLFNNKLQSINPEWFTSLHNLKGLSLKGNQISEIQSNCFTSLISLRVLYAHENNIKILNSNSFKGLQNLQTLYLYGNEISDLPVGVFAQLENLKALNLRNNYLKSIHSDSFGLHNQLTTIWLENNKINEIDPKFIDNTAVSTLTMINNICSKINPPTTKNIKQNLKKCFENYQPRSIELNACGIGTKAHGTIIGGNEARRGEFPWIAALIGPDDKYFCGGTLVSNRKVVTAAHCMVFLARDVTVLLGVHDLSKQHEVGRFPYAVQNIHIHPDWNPYTETYDADIAVIVLVNEVIYGQNIQSICLMYSNSTLTSKSEGVVVGYGKDEKPNISNLNIPKYLKIPIHSNEDCFLKNNIFVKISSKRTFCGGSGNGTGTCKGDSGSGLFVNDGSAYYLRGIVSTSLYNLTYNCDVDNYSVFTNILFFTKWIDEVPVDPTF